MSLLDLKGVKSEVEGKPILKGVDLKINKGEVHVIMGPNGAGKSTLASILVGHPKHEIVGGRRFFKNCKRSCKWRKTIYYAIS